MAFEEEEVLSPEVSGELLKICDFPPEELASTLGISKESAEHIQDAIEDYLGMPDGEEGEEEEEIEGE